jgi:CHASE2 domain-containing sensor protein
MDKISSNKIISMGTILCSLGSVFTVLTIWNNRSGIQTIVFRTIAIIIVLAGVFLVSYGIASSKKVKN